MGERQEIKAACRGCHGGCMHILTVEDGRLVKVCDTLAAFIEAHSSIYNGVSSPHLYEAMARIRSEYRLMTLGSFNVGTLLADFD